MCPEGINQNALDPVEGIETIGGRKSLSNTFNQNALDPLEGIETMSISDGKFHNFELS